MADRENREGLLQRARGAEARLADAALTIGRARGFEEAHAAQVSKLALALFDQLAALHRLAAAERRILLAAALLHDVGMSVAYQGHHKHSLEIIASLHLPGLTPGETLAAANVARYHRKAEPSPEHRLFAALTDPDRERVEKLAAILRLADALDRSHRQGVGALRAEDLGDELRLTLSAQGDLDAELAVLPRKAAFFERVYRRRVTVAVQA